MRRLLLAGCVLSLVATPAYARGHGRHPHRNAVSKASKASKESFFLAGDPHVPLAVVKDGQIGDKTFSNKGCGAPNRWKKIGSRWRALDAWGQPLGVFTASSKDDYYAFGCAELSFSPKLPNDLTHVFVSIDSAWTAAPSVEWAPPAARRSAFTALANRSLFDANVSLVWDQCKSIPERARFFHVPGRGDWAIATSNTGWMVARDDKQGWSVLNQERPKTTAESPQCFRPVAVFDMNGDGIPEIVLRFSGGDGWQDLVLAIDEDNHWKVVSSSPGGSTA
jgi:hypothetical protein